ncbi:MAG TPA: T9SS type A sorting domain-containing protein, partial [Solirubrobacterales bacterium]|nr:T9SS type A sorting domain-containing protein [Solirubrobacterales bacterium]
FNPAKLKQLAWEVKIDDQKSSAIVKDTAAFTVTDVKFYGISDLPVEPGTGVKGKVAKSAFGASYKSGELSLQGLAGFKSVDVVSISGKTVASVSPVGKTTVKLDRGTYVLVAKGEGKTLTRKLAVAQ